MEYENFVFVWNIGNFCGNIPKIISLFSWEGLELCLFS